MLLFKTPRFFKWIFPRRTWGFSRSINAVYLTFDDGPTPEITPWILDFLNDKKIKATFFCVGSNIIKYPDLYHRILAEGHKVGNHTMNHEKSKNVAFKEYKDSILRTELLVKNNLFRPPYGRLNSIKANVLSKHYKIIMWSWLSYDYDYSVPITSILEKAKEQIKAGDIIVLHDNIKVKTRIKEILPDLIIIIEEKKLSFSLVE